MLQQYIIKAIKANMKTRLAKIDDLLIIMDMIDNGRKHIQEYNIPQWINGPLK